MNNHIQVTLKSSTIEMNLNSPEESIYLVPELEGLTTLPEIRTSSGVNAGADGGWTSAQLFDARLISMRLVIANEDIAVVESKRRLLNTLLAQGRNEELVLNITTEAGNAYTVNVRVTSVSASLDRVLHRQDFLIQFRADDPLIYGSTEGGGVEAILNVQKALGGFAIPFTFPLAIGGGSDGTVVQNVGTETVYPIIALYGNLHSPTVINRTTNQQLQIIADLASDIIWGQSQTAQGEYIQITNDLDIPAKLASVEMLGNAEQTTYSGKNLLSLDNNTPSANTNMTVTHGVNDLKIVAATTTGAQYASIQINLDATKTYTLSGVAKKTVAGTDGRPWIYIRWRGSNDNGSTWTAYTDMFKNQTPTQGTTYPFSGSFTGYARYQIAFYNNANTPVTVGETTEYYDIQLELGSTATAYEPYVGGTPAPNPQFPMPISVVTGENTVKVVGKNLLDPANIVGANITVVDDTLTLTNSGGYNVTAEGCTLGTICPNLVAGQTYVLSFNTTETSVNHHDDIYIRSASNYWTKGTSRTLTQTDIDSRIAFYGTNATVSNIQLEHGSTVTSYQAYTEQDFEINLGKNLTSLTGQTNITWGNTNNNFKNFLNTLGVGTYTFSCKFTLTSRDDQTDASKYGFFFAYGDGNIIDRPEWGNVPVGTTKDYSLTFTITEAQVGTFTNVYAYGCGSAGATGSADASEFQVERGSSATSYSDYFTPIELAKIGTYQDRIYKEGEKWYVEKQVGKVVLDGTETGWGYNSTSKVFWGKNSALLPNSGFTDATTGYWAKMSDNFTYYAQSGNVATLPDGLYENSSTGAMAQILSHYSAITSLADWKTWLGAHPTTVYYALATPTTTEITNEALIAQLDALESASLYLGVNNIGTETQNAMPTLALGYYTSYEKQTDVVVIDSQANTITLNGLDIYNLMTEGSEFIEIAPGDNIMLLTSTQTSDDGYAEIKYKQGYLSI